MTDRTNQKQARRGATHRDCGRYIAKFSAAIRLTVMNLVFVFIGNGCTANNPTSTYQPPSSRGLSTVEGTVPVVSSSAKRLGIRSRFSSSNHKGAWGSCTPVAKLYEISSSTEAPVEPAIEEVKIGNDGTFRFSSSDRIKSLTQGNTKVPALIKIEGCSFVLSRPVTGGQSQVVSSASTLLGKSFELGRKSGILSANRQTVAELVSALEGTLSDDLGDSTSLEKVYVALQKNSALSAQFEAAFGYGPTALTDSPPVLSIVSPTLYSVSESTVVTLVASVSHWSSQYPLSQSWVVDSVKTSSLVSSTLVFGKNAKSSAVVEVTAGQAAGSGVDLSKPYSSILFTLSVTDSYPVVAPVVSLVSPTFTSPVLTRSLVIGVGQDPSVCETFTGYTYKIDSANQPAAADFTRTCGGAGSPQALTLNLSAGDGSRVIRFWSRDINGAVSSPTAITLTLKESDPRSLQLSAASPVSAGSCQSVTITELGADGVTAERTLDPRVVSLSGSFAAQFYSSSDTDCTGSSTSATTIAATQSAAQLRFRTTSAGVLTLTAASSGLSAGTAAVAVVPLAPDYLTIASGNSQTGQRNVQLGSPIVVSISDVYGNSITSQTVTLSYSISSGGGTIGSASVASVSPVSNTWTLGSGAAAANNNTLTVSRAGTALPDLAGTGRSTVTFTATSVNGAPTLTVPSHRLFPIAGSNLPWLVGSSYGLTVTGSDVNGDSLTYSCTIGSSGLSTSDVGYIASGTACSSLASFTLWAGAPINGKATFNASTGVLGWTPMLKHRGTYAFTFGASDGQGGTDSKTVFVSTRAPFTTTNLISAWSPRASVSTSTLSSTIGAAPRLDASGDDSNTASWLDMLGVSPGTLSGFFSTSAPWTGNGSRATPYALGFNGSSDRLDLGTSLAAITQQAFSIWINPSDVSSTAQGKIILTTGGETGSGFVLKQGDLDASKVELQVGVPTYSSLVLTDGAVSYWRLNESSGNFADSGPAGVTCTTNGAISRGTASAITNSSDPSAFFNGSVNLNCGNNSAHQLAGSFSVEIWIKTSVNPGVSGTALVNKYSGDQGFYLHMDQNGKVGFDGRNSTSTYRASGMSSAALSDGVWHHVVGVRRGGVWEVYVDGALASASSDDGVQTGASNTSADLLINTFAGSSFGSSLYMDEVAIYGDALTAQQVYNHYQAGKGKFQSNKLLQLGAIGYWPLDSYDASTSTFTNRSAITGSNAYMVNGYRQWAPGPYGDHLRGGAGLASVSSQYITIAAFPSNTYQTKFTHSYWLRPSTIPSSGYVYPFADNASAYNGTCIDANGQVTVYIYSGAAYDSLGSSTFLAANTWYHLVEVIDSTQSVAADRHKLYINGQLQTRSNGGCLANNASLAQNAVIHAPGNGYRVGTYWGASAGTFYNGFISDLAVFNRALSAAEVTSLYSSSNVQKCQSLTSLSASDWFNISGIWSGTTMSLLFNGKTECSFTPQTSSITPSTHLFVGGGGAGTDFFTGSVGDIRLFGSSDGSAPASAATLSSDYFAEAGNYSRGGTGNYVTNGLVLNLDAETADRGLFPQTAGCNASQMSWTDSVTGDSSFIISNTASTGCGSTQGWVGDGTYANPRSYYFNSTYRNFMRMPAAPENPNFGIVDDMTAEMMINIYGRAHNYTVLAAIPSVFAIIDVALTSYDWDFYTIDNQNRASDYYRMHITGTSLWWHMVWTKSGTSVSCYLNGAPYTCTVTASGNAQNTTLGTATAAPYLGINDYAYQNPGPYGTQYTMYTNLMRYALYKRALSASEVRQNCRALQGRLMGTSFHGCY